MQCNVGGTEKNIRLTIGAASIVVGLFAGLPRGARIALLAMGAVEITTALTGYCPVNEMLGRNTCITSLPDAAREALHDAQVLAE